MWVKAGGERLQVPSHGHHADYPAPGGLCSVPNVQVAYCGPGDHFGCTPCASQADLPREGPWGGDASRGRGAGDFLPPSPSPNRWLRRLLLRPRRYPSPTRSSARLPAGEHVQVVWLLPMPLTSSCSRPSLRPAFGSSHRTYRPVSVDPSTGLVSWLYSGHGIGSSPPSVLLFHAHHGDDSLPAAQQVAQPPHR